MSKRIIKKVAVLGSGVMGSRIACHFAGAGIPVILLDMDNKLAADSLAAAVKSNPSPLYSKNALKLISTGGFNEKMKDVASCDWIIEVVVERLDIKQKIFEDVERYRTAGTLVTSNT